MLQDHRMNQLVNEIKERASGKLYVATAESCTGGMLSAALTNIAGSSTFFERGFVTYSNEAKQEILGVSKHTLDTYGAVSEETAMEMAKGCLANSRAQYALSITGIAGPSGGTAEKPVGMVCFGLASKQEARTYSFNFSGDRDSVRHQASIKALELLNRHIQRHA